MAREKEKHWQRPLMLQLTWFVSLRWLAGLAVVAGALLEARGSGLFGHPLAITLVGAAILGYNAVLWVLTRRGGTKQERHEGTEARRHEGEERHEGTKARRHGGESPGDSALSTQHSAHSTQSPTSLIFLACAQLLLDLTALTTLTLLTGGVASPLLGFFVLHMVFASLLLWRGMAYASALIAIGMVTGGLWLTGQWPDSAQWGIQLLAWAVLLLSAVWLTNTITRNLRRQRRRLVRQNRRIRQMTRALRRHQRAIIQQEKMVAVGQMAAGVAHEIANPLASIDGLLQLMARRPEKLRPEALSTLREQVDRINRILRQMTSFSHPGDEQWRTGTLNEVVEKGLQVIRFDPRLKRVALQQELAEGMPRVRMLADALQQVVINIAINALDAMEGVADPRLVVRTSSEGGWCQVEIIDNGHGIGKSARRHIFEPFYTTKPVGKGTGLGLSISYSLVRRHGGEILVESRPGEGARFTIRLPAENPSDSPIADCQLPIGNAGGI